MYHASNTWRKSRIVLSSESYLPEMSPHPAVRTTVTRTTMTTKGFLPHVRGPRGSEQRMWMLASLEFSNKSFQNVRSLFDEERKLCSAADDDDDVLPLACSSSLQLQ